MTAQPRRRFQRFLCATLPAALAGTLTIGGAAAYAAPAKSKKAQPSSAGKSTGSKTNARSAGQVLQSGKASWYGPGFHGRKTANGERFDMYELTAAHKTLPLGTRIKVLNPANGKEVVVRINDRGPYAHGRILDLSKAAASQLGLISRGHGDVVLQALGERSDGTGLSSTLASADTPDPDHVLLPGYSRHQTQMLAQTLAQTRFGDSRFALGNPVPSEPLPSWPVNDALTGLPIMAPMGLAASTPDAGPGTGLNLPSWAQLDTGMPRLASIPSFGGTDMAPTTTVARALDEAGSTAASQPQAPSAVAVAGVNEATQQAAMPGLSRHQVVDEAKLVSVRHVPSAIAAGDLMLSGADPSLRMPMPVESKAPDAGAAIVAGNAADLP
jgi:rare lipoprotein A